MKLLRCTDGRVARIPRWLFDEFHLDAAALGERDDPLPPVYRMPLDETWHYNRIVFDCATALAETAEEAIRDLGLAPNVNEAPK